MSEDALASIAQRMDQQTYPKGSIIIQQDDLGDSFYAIQEGEVEVTRKANARDPDEVPTFITKFGPNSTFGEMSLVTDEMRSATVTVCSEKASVLQLTRQIFDELMEANKKITDEVTDKMTYNVIHHSCSLFSALPPLSRKLLIDKMTQSTFAPGSYICRQGKPGIRFFIIISGRCEVIIDDDDDPGILSISDTKKNKVANIKNGEVVINSHEHNVNVLHPGDFFGEIALFSAAQLCTANVVAIDSVVCMGLNRVDFQLIFSHMQAAISDMHQNYVSTGVKIQGVAVTGAGSKPSNFRRITGLAGACAVGNDGYVDTLLKRMAKYMSECLWNSLYSRMYRDLMLRSSAEAECGPYATEIMQACGNRLDGVRAIRARLVKIMALEAEERSSADLMFLEELVGWRRCKFTSKYCEKWRQDQLVDLCKCFTFRTVRACGIIFKFNTPGTDAFIILKGGARVFTEQFDPQLKRLKLAYEQDLFPGEYFGETALEGLHHRGATVQALTDVDLLVVDYEQYNAARGQNHGQNQIRTQDKELFLKTLPLFKGVDNYTVSRFAHALYYAEVRKGNKVMSRNESSSEISFIFNGSVDLLRKLPGNLPLGAAVPPGTYSQQSVVATLQSGDYYCESGLINLRNEQIRSRDRVVECCDAVSSTRLGVLKLSVSEALGLLPKDTLNQMSVAFTAKTDWRLARGLECRVVEVEKRKKKIGHRLDFLFEDAPLDHLPTLEELSMNSRDKHQQHQYDSDHSPPRRPSVTQVHDAAASPPNPYAVKSFDGDHLGLTPAAARDNNHKSHLPAPAPPAPLSDLTQARYSLLYLQKHIALPTLASVGSVSTSSFTTFHTPSNLSSPLGGSTGPQSGSSSVMASPGKLFVDTPQFYPRGPSLDVSSPLASLSSLNAPSSVGADNRGVGGGPGELPQVQVHVRPSKSRKSRRKKGIDVEMAKSNLRSLHTGLSKLKPMTNSEFGPEVKLDSALPSSSMYMYNQIPLSIHKPLGSISTNSQEDTDADILDDSGSVENPVGDACLAGGSINSLDVNSVTHLVRAIPVGNKSLGALLHRQLTKLSPRPFEDNTSNEGYSSPKPLPDLKDIPSLINPFDNPIQVLSGCTNPKEVGRAMAAFAGPKSRPKKNINK